MRIEMDLRALDALIAVLPDQIDEWLAGEAEEIVNDIKLSFNTGPAGRSYPRGSKTHVASQAGYPPNVDTGALRASIRMDKVGHLHYEVLDGVEYGIQLEEGTQRYGARPFFRPVFDAHSRTLASRFPKL
jgi:hypothetical protein